MQKARKRTRGVLQLAGILVLSASGLAAAAGGQGRDPRGEAEAVLKGVESGSGRETVKELTGRARAALARVDEREKANDAPGAELAAGLALAWANAARDAVRAADAERQAAAARSGADDAGARADRERALLEEGIAQTGRLRAQLDALAREGRERQAKTNEAGADAGAPRPAPKPKHGTMPERLRPPARDGGAS